MLFNDEFINSVRDDPITGAIQICQKTFDALELENHQGWYEEDFDILVESYSLIAALVESYFNNH